MAEEEWIAPLGEVINWKDLQAPRALSLARALLAGLPYSKIVECRRIVRDNGSSEFESVVMDVEPEVPQHPANDIRSIERIAAWFPISDGMVEAQVLRQDFPSTSHVTFFRSELPKSLCLYYEPWDEVRLRWTPAGFVARVRDWLAKTARDELHEADQPLEPMFAAVPSSLVLPASLIGQADEGDDLSLTRIYAIEGKPGQATFFALSSSIPKKDEGRVGQPCVATLIATEPKLHGVLHTQPAVLADLSETLATSNVDLNGILRDRLKRWQQDKPYEEVLEANLILIVALPKTREVGGKVESTEYRVFLINQSLKTIGEDLGIWHNQDGVPGLLVPTDESKQGQNIQLYPLNPLLSFSREQAALLSGSSTPNSLRIAAVGLGALGSQIFLNLIREGFGEWVLIDLDLLLPHNIARHPLSSSAVGFSKVGGLAVLALDTIDGPPIAHPLVADVLYPGEKAQELEDAFRQSNLILDCSASVPVARRLARNVEATARRVSVFMNPTGTDGVLIIEDSERQIPLDLLEMQYYRAVVQDEALTNHLGLPAGHMRYGAGCRDQSNVVPQELVALHAATASRVLREVVLRTNAAINLWRTNSQDFGISSITIPASQKLEIQVEGWTIITDNWFRDDIGRIRREHLPNETGGVLIGAFDIDRHLIYVIDSIPSPPDSEEWPTLYIRGSDGLAERVRSIDRTSAGNLQYVGEWHSHPDGASVCPSNEDRQVFAWLAERRVQDGFPPLMLIAGDQDQFGWYCNEIK